MNSGILREYKKGTRARLNPTGWGWGVDDSRQNYCILFVMQNRSEPDPHPHLKKSTWEQYNRFLVMTKIKKIFKGSFNAVFYFCLYLKKLT